MNTQAETLKFLQCGAKTRTGGRCKYKAGYKTDHVGTGRCHLHGGRTKGAGAPKGNKNGLKHGRYSKAKLNDTPTLENKQELERVQEFNAVKPEREKVNEPEVIKPELDLFNEMYRSRSRRLQS